MSDRWSELAEQYAANRIGYSPEVYEAIARFGLHRGATILDVGCGTGIAAAPFVSNGFAVTGVDPSPAMLAKAEECVRGANFVQGSAEALPFPDERFNVVVSAQTFHWLDRSQALAQAHRVLRSGGLIAIWWKHLMARDPVNLLRAQTLATMGKASPEGLAGGFKEFYASPFVGQTLRVIPWRTAMPLDQFMGYERSRCSIRRLLGKSSQAYFDGLEARLRERCDGDATISLAYIHYVYLAKKT